MGYCGRSGHCGVVVTKFSMEWFCDWKSMPMDKENFFSSCSNCALNICGRRVTVPPGHAMHAEKPIQTFTSTVYIC